jgi:hypothetical protein
MDQGASHTPDGGTLPASAKAARWSARTLEDRLTVRRCLTLLGAAAVVLSCREPGPVGLYDASTALEGRVVSSSGSLLRCRPLAYDSVTEVVGPAGATLRVSRHVLNIPGGAITKRVAITLVAPSDSVNRIRFAPEGLLFQKPVALTMSYANCDLDGSNVRQVAYTTDSLAIVEYEPSVDDVVGKKVTGALSHFSGYAVAW